MCRTVARGSRKNEKEYVRYMHAAEYFIRLLNTPRICDSRCLIFVVRGGGRKVSPVYVSARW